MTPTVRGLIRSLRLQPHPEGGFFRESWRSPRTARFPGYAGRRSYATAIVFLIPAGTVSRWHRVASDELWCWQGGGNIELAELIRGRVRITRIGAGRGSVLQHVVPGGYWFAARPARGCDYALAGCVVAPGFDFKDFELADSERLVRLYRRSAALIRAFAGARPRGRRARRR